MKKRWYLSATVALLALASLIWPGSGSGPEQMRTAQQACPGLLSLAEARMARAMGQVPAQVGDLRCLKTAYHSDLFAVAELQPDSAPAGWTFAPLQGVQEVPVDLLFEMFPEAFAPDQRDRLTIASGFDPESRASVALIRRADARLFVLIADQM